MQRPNDARPRVQARLVCLAAPACLFAARHAAAQYSLQKLASFNSSNGADPGGKPTQDASGNLFGTTVSGGPGGVGTVFELAKGTTSLTTLASFSGPNGNGLRGDLTMDAAGNLSASPTKAAPATARCSRRPRTPRP